MCCWAILSTNVSTLVLGARRSQFMTRDAGSYSVEALTAMTGCRLEIVTGVLQRECAALRYAALERMVGEERTTDRDPKPVHGSGVLQLARKAFSAICACIRPGRKS